MPNSRPSPAPLVPLVVIVDDEAAVRDSLDSLFRSIGLHTRVFASPAELLREALPDVAGCLVLDVRLPGISGLDFQAQLAAQGVALPIVFMTGHGDIPMTVRAMKAGAVDFLAKPFRDQDMLDAVSAAIERDRQRRAQAASLDQVRGHYETLTPREREVMAHVVSGLMNKQVAGLIGLSEITVKIHRGNVMRKMGVRSLADLVRHAEALGIHGPQTSV
ncbi:two-component system response regulator [Stenotrophomonas panacihumi]|uniref:Two-component system response regulator n=1 Tax=Stenotrophomonas panacihumi TaxID=676599 RepID=A0A0R0AZQ0_9GAMM|nr:response regulator transcription factor [Stenotrophomonas panacihumi]KRG47890.1 two-component system response regulator [Stenotrophomonas panacihumi]PTN55715.1 DNA-binding response regulator [Stenotrophomonas panacihumi]